MRCGLQAFLARIFECSRGARFTEPNLGETLLGGTIPPAEHPTTIDPNITPLLSLPTADLAAHLNDLPHEDAARVLLALPHDLAHAVADEEELVQLPAMLAHLPYPVAIRLLTEMAPDQRVDLLQELDATLRESLITGLPPTARAEATELLSYKPHSAGGLMTTEFTTVRPEWTAAQCLANVREVARDKETIYAIYVTEASHYDTLLGVLSLRDLLLAEPAMHAHALMHTPVVSVPLEAHQSEVARTMSRYDLLAIPVVDEAHRCRGIVTVDDMVDALVAEQTRDYLGLGAVSSVITEQGYLRAPILLAVRGRVPWLLFLFVGGTLTGGVMEYYSPVTGQWPDLLPYMPLLIGTGGNVGSQTVTTVIRGLALDEIAASDWLQVLGREVRTGLTIGVILGVLGYLFSMIVHPGMSDLALVVSLAVLAICTWSCTVGSMIPLLAKRLGADPAVLSAPLISTLVDATGLIIFFSIAWGILH